VHWKLCAMIVDYPGDTSDLKQVL